jgi:GT2 family glycosyltransferase
MISLYVPCYNGAAWLERCIDSLLAQTVSVQELLVVDDGSTDESAAIARRRERPVRLVQHERNRGLAVARNTALAHATGEIVASVDADVCASPTWLNHLLEGFDSPRTAAVGGKLMEARQERLADRWRAVHMAQHAGDFPLLNPPVLPGANMAVRKSVVQRLGGYEESFRTNYEDADLKVRLLEVGYQTRYTPAAVAQHLRTDTASSVLRTYWGWLRPPFQRQGSFTSFDRLLLKQTANTDFATQALWTDFSGSLPQLAYLSLLVMLAFPMADVAHAARDARERDDEALATRFAASATALTHRLPQALATCSPRLAAHLPADLSAVDWWSAPRDASTSQSSADASAIATAVADGLQQLPRAWWPAIQDSRDLLAAEEGWPVSAAAGSRR